MEKMVYERPVMRIEAFQANEYVAACERLPVIGTALNYFRVMFNDVYYYFNKTSVEHKNDTNGRDQYYYTSIDNSVLGNYKDDAGNVLQNPDGLYFLEYSNTWYDHSFYLYQDDQSDRAGYYSSKNSNAQFESGVGTLQTTGDIWDRYLSGGDRAYSGGENATGFDSSWYVADIGKGSVTYDSDVKVQMSFSN